MSASNFLDTLRKHELSQFYPTFSTHGITHLQSLAQLSLQDYSRLGITDTVDRRKIFGLVQSIRKESDSARPSMSTSGLRQPQNMTNNTTRTRRQSIIGNITKSPPQQQQTLERPIRSRTMSDAPRPDPSLFYQQQQQRQAPFKDPSAPLLDAYGVPLSSAKQAQRSSNISIPTTTTFNNLPPSDLNQKIRVCVRKRPLSKKELEKADKDVAPLNGTRSLQINEPKLRLDLTRYTEQHSFTFDDVFDLNCPNSNVYKRTALPLVHYIFKGGKATCFAYGQTGSGKTFTMLDPKQGLYIMAARDIFSMLLEPENQHLSAWIGLYEIYQGQLYDLLNERKKLFAREDGKNNVIVTGLKEYPIDNVDKLIQVFDYGSSVRSTGSTGANDSSSRSHAVLQILLKHKSNRKKIHGKLSFIDLAGSERGADRGEADTKTRMEGAEINKSLLALKECIRALDQDKRHTPFRQSKLTQVLKDSFVGNSRTCMIATISPGGSNSEHTLNTLRYADRVKELKGERDRKTAMERSTSGGSLPETNDDTFNVDEENIFDVDFPHEQDALIHTTFNPTNVSPQKSPPPPTSLPPLSSTNNRYSHTNNTSGNSRPNSISFHHHEPSTPSSRPLSLQMKRSSSTLPRSFSMYSPSRNSIESDNSSTYSAPQRTQPQYAPDAYRQQQQIDALASLSGVPSFSYDHMDEFVKFHRAEIREITDCTKKETKLVANISLDLSSNQDFDDHRSSVDTKSTTQFHKYLQDLDEILERKLAAVEALRDRISDTVGQVEL
ncbi:hypothetical protein INT48_008184 [Thamnidium elegans]|uniref:Kinesin-like protein n=1 Tax=Thamnidium elegans TaxID=101142 RepID=A0A8H7VVD1_9FUNG|nr:hypothetical protein INT48_008184 [Thamnidium elegans]